MAFIDQGESEAMKTLMGHRALHCDKCQSCAKMTVSTQIVFEILLLNMVVLTRKNKRKKKRIIRKMALSLPYTSAFSCLLRRFWPII